MSTPKSSLNKPFIRGPQHARGKATGHDLMGEQEHIIRIGAHKIIVQNLETIWEDGRYMFP